MRQFEIRFATADDVPLILAFVRKLAEYERLAHRVTVTEDDLREALFAERPCGEVLIGQSDRVAVSFALFYHTLATFAGERGLYVEDLFVEPAHRGRGIGRAMLAFLAALARQRNCRRLEWSVLGWNAPAVKFYKSLGAEAMDDWTVYRLRGDAFDALAAR